MRPQIVILFIVLFSTMLCGCPYKSAVPLERASVRINPTLIGRWGEPSDTSEVYFISMRDSFSYNIEVRKTNAQNNDHYVAWLSHLKNETFVNVKEDKANGAAPGYLFYKIVLSGRDKMILSTVTENIREQFTSSAELKKFFMNNMKNSYFFEKDQATLIRK